jgi:erythrin-vacuolar iron transport family protein
MGTLIGGVLHTLPFLIPTYITALVVAIGVVAFELVALAYLRHLFFRTGFARSLGAVTLGGAPIAAVSALLGSVA